MCRRGRDGSHIALVTDAYARRILVWSTSTSMTTQLVLDGVEHAIWTRGRHGVADLGGVIHHTDAGSQSNLILQDGDYRVKASNASQIQRIDQIGAAGELPEAAMRLRQPGGSGRAGARAFLQPTQTSR